MHTTLSIKYQIPLYALNNNRFSFENIFQNDNESAQISVYSFVHLGIKKPEEPIAFLNSFQKLVSLQKKVCA